MADQNDTSRSRHTRFYSLDHYLSADVGRFAEEKALCNFRMMLFRTYGEVQRLDLWRPDIDISCVKDRNTHLTIAVFKWLFDNGSYVFEIYGDKHDVLKFRR